MFSRRTLRRRSAERGAAAAIVAVLLGFGVLLGASALAVDIGNVAFDRRQQQNGADAGAKQLAKLCAESLAKCSAGSAGGPVTAAIKANFPSSTRQTSGQLQSMCGRAGTGTLPVCASAVADADIKDLTKCPPLSAQLKAAPTVKYVEVQSKTLDTADGSDDLKSFFNVGSGTTMTACARYAWGPAGSATTLPLTFAECEWKGSITAPTGGFGVETSLPLKYSKKAASACTLTSPSGGDFAGGFGWLSTSVGCDLGTAAGKWYDAQPGVGGGSGCYDLFKPGSVAYVPIFDCISDSKTFCVPGSPSGTHTWYHIKGYAAFYITAVDITGSGDALPGYPGAKASSECKTESLDNKCIYGWFLDDYVDDIGEIDYTGTVPDYGADVFKAAG